MCTVTRLCHTETMKLAEVRRGVYETLEAQEMSGLEDTYRYS